MTAGKPVSGRPVRARIDTDTWGAGLTVDVESYSVTTDAEGRFSLTNLPPGRWDVFGMCPSATKAILEWTAWTDALVRPEETTEVALGGAELRFRVKPPEGLESFSPSNVWAILGPRMALENASDYARWMASQKGDPFAGSPRGVAISFVNWADRRDGIWFTEGGTPGNQELTVQIHDPRTHEVLAKSVRSVVLSEMQTRGVVDLGVIELRAVEKPPAEPRAE